MQLDSISLIDLYLISPGLCLFLTAVIVLMTKFLFKNQKVNRRAVSLLSAGSLVATALLSSSISSSLYGGEVLAFKGALIFNAFTYWVTVVIVLGALFSALLFYKNEALEGSQFSEFLFLFLNSILGAMVVLWSNNLLVLFVGIELVSLPLYTMTLLSRINGHTKESAVKYYILGSVASAFFLLGMVLVYGSSVNQFGGEVLLGIMKLSEASTTLMKVDHLFLLGSTFMLLAAFLKLGLFPFHNWVPDVYQGANTSVTYYMITVAKVSAVVVIVKLMLAGFLTEAVFMKMAIQWIVVLSMIFGALFALFQQSIKRMLAYSGVAQSGFMLMPILGFGFDGEGSIDQLIFYFITYTFFLGLVFYYVQKLETKKGSDILLMDLEGLGSLWPRETVLLLMGVVGLSGMPPLIGFMTKVYIFKAAVHTGFYWVVFWGLISTVISIVYYLKIIERMYFYKRNEVNDSALWANPLEKKALTWLGLIQVVIIGLASMTVIYLVPVNV